MLSHLGDAELAAGWDPGATRLPFSSSWITVAGEVRAKLPATACARGPAEQIMLAVYFG